MIEWVERLVAEAPLIYLGDEPYKVWASVADQIASRKKLDKALEKLSVDPSDADAAAERDRLMKAFAAWRDKEISQIERALATTPSTVVPALQDLAKELGGAEFAAPVQARHDALAGTPEMTAALKIEKLLAKTKRKVEKLKVPKEAKRRGIKIFDLADKDCRAAHAKTLSRAAKKLRDAIASQPALPIAKTVAAYATQLDP